MTEKTFHSYSPTTVVISLMAVLLVCVTKEASSRRVRRCAPPSVNTSDSHYKTTKGKLDELSKALASLCNTNHSVFIPRTPGPPGRPGCKGQKGTQGRGMGEPATSQGPMGMEGRSGQLGITGPCCLKGEKGDEGPRGMAGLKGETGKSPLFPDVEVSPLVLTVNESQSAVLYCSSTSNPRPVIGWSKVGGSMDKNKSVIEGNGKLEIKNTTLNDSGVYQCRGYNIHGAAQETAQLIVNYAPRLSLDSGLTYMYIAEGDNITLPTCHVTGFPAPKVTWSRASGQLPRARVIVKNGQLTLLETQRRDTDTYVCKAENLLGWSLGKIYLAVVRKPVFTEKPLNKTLARLTSLVSITSRVRGDSPTVITWRRLEGDLPAGRSEVRDGTLTIRNFQVSDIGMYICTATTAGVSRAETTTRLAIVEDCSELYKSGLRRNGVYTVDPGGRGAFQVYCDMITDGGGWTVFQRRQDGSVNFYRNWNQYKTGFGNLTGEFWLGNGYIHRLTTRTASALRVELWDWRVVIVYAKYGNFSVGDEESKYRLNVSSYSGSAGDALAWHKDMAFTTIDRDNDLAVGNCAVQYIGAWWYNACHNSNLNGRYLGNKADPTGVVWFHFNSNVVSLKFSEMKLRPQSHS